MSDELTGPPDDPADLADFPRLALGPRRRDVVLYRVHRVGYEPNFYGAGSNRFDPPIGVTTFGTCYCATDPEGALVEVFGDTGPVISETDFASRAITVLTLDTGACKIADFTDPKVLGRYGLTGTASAGGPASYWVCRLWAAALFTAGFGGIRYFARHDPSLTRESFAVFGQPGVSKEPLRVGWTDTLDETHREMLAAYGFGVLPAAPLLP